MAINILLTSDWHNAPFAGVKFQSQKKNLGELLIQWLGGRGKNAILRRMKEVIRLERIKTVVNNGDLQEGSFNERGLSSESDLTSAKKTVQLFERETDSRMMINIGNHESGYHQLTLPLATDPKGGASVSSVNNALKLIGKPSPYYSVAVDDYRFIFIPYLMTEKIGKDFDIEKMKAEILCELQSDLSDTAGRVIVFIHDPDSLADDRLSGLIRKYRDRIDMIFFGHCHAEFSVLINKWLARIFSWKRLFPFRMMLRLVLNLVFDSDISKRVQEYYLERLEVSALIDEFGAKLIPAPDGMMGFGGGFLVLDLETLEVTKY